MHKITKECNQNIINHIKNNTNYDTKLIYDNITRTQDIKPIKKDFKYYKYYRLAKLGLKHYKEQFDKKYNEKIYKETFEGMFE